jgi:hypothetical protein
VKKSNLKEDLVVPCENTECLRGHLSHEDLHLYPGLSPFRVLLSSASRMLLPDRMPIPWLCKRKTDHFPPDFMLQLSEPEKVKAVANCDHLQRLKFSPVLPYALTEHGAIMAAPHLPMPPEEDPPREPFGFRRAKKD